MAWNYPDGCGPDDYEKWCGPDPDEEDEDEDEESYDEEDEDLRPREIEYLTLVAKGLRRREIAEKMGIAITTVKYYHKEMMSVLCARTAAEAVYKAFQRGIFKVTQ